MDLSFWERQTWFADIDYTVIGSGIVGLHTALRLRERFPTAKILIIEKGMLPQGASTKNAGFACFGSISEIIDDLKTHSEQQVISLISRRWQGLRLLRSRLGDSTIDFRAYGGYELFLKDDEDGLQQALSKTAFINDLLRPLFRADVFTLGIDRFGFEGIQDLSFFNPFEAQIDTGKMMLSLLQSAIAANILILNRQAVSAYHENDMGVSIGIGDFSFQSRKLLLATNGFASQMADVDVKPARAQVLVTSPIENLDIKGTFHLDKGYYYFRNIGDRILLGGGRNLDFATETTTAFGLTNIVQQRLEDLLTEVILPGRDFTIEQRWSGIIGLGSEKNPIVSQLSEHVFCGVRLGGMGVAIGSLIGTELADLVQA